MTNKWNYQSPNQEQLLKRDELSHESGLYPAVCLLLVQRGINTAEELHRFINPTTRDLHDPFLFPDMQKAVNRLNQALGNKEKILVYGDYDVDGTTAVALVYTFLAQNTWFSNLYYYIPDRYDEGYGISDKGIAYAVEKGVTLVISLDCGIKAIDKIAEAKSLGIDFIICDHHKVGDVLPDAVAILDAKRPDSTYPYEHLSGCGVGFKFMHAFAISNGIDFSRLSALLDFAALSIAADIVPVTGENRIIAAIGLKQLNHAPSNGLKGIINVCGLSGKEITMNDIIFKIGPRINASGRMMNSREAVDLLLEKDVETVKEKSENINQYNDNRRELDKKVTDEAYALIGEDKEAAGRKIIVIYNPDWHKGVIGIVASRITDKYYKPAIVLTDSNGYICGSARSLMGFDIYKAIESCKDILVNFGGHPFAAGVTLEHERLELFKSRIEAYTCENMSEKEADQTLHIDAILKLNEINMKLYTDMKCLSPFGYGNTKPVFCSFGVRDSGTSKRVGKKLEHIKLDLIDDSTNEAVSAIAFNMHQYDNYIKSGRPFDICYTVEENNFGNRTTVQLMVKEIR
ncbi:MAG: single-stranded-DNA-specific exonuclease RecJ [Dysgonamonadaceae bacterium]|jgi:single-stranded-DNA-specific exonuclease|nr:single-stranded-DNA-specific exonuclease RecJ [Dysgonamonadaceae bacterium]